jgi:hypothetical protein
LDRRTIQNKLKQDSVSCNERLLISIGHQPTTQQTNNPRRLVEIILLVGVVPVLVYVSTALILMKQ